MSLIKAIDDELVYKIMNRLEQKHCVQYIEKSLPVHVLSQSFSESMRDITLTCIDDIVEGIENAKKMERFFVVFKVVFHRLHAVVFSQSDILESWNDQFFSIL